MRAMKVPLSILLFLLLAGCAPSCCQWNDIDYETPEAARAVQLKEYDELMVDVAPAAERIGGRARVVCPDQSRIKEIEKVSQRGLAEDTAQWLVESWRTYCDQAVKLLKKRNLFDYVDGRQLYAVDTPQADVDYVIYFYLFDPDGTQWYIRAQGSSQPQGIPRNIGLPKKGRPLPWLNAIYILARESRTP